MKERTEDNIRNAFLSLYLNKYFDQISVKEVCTRANVSRTTFYTYYEDLNMLLSEIEDTIIDDMLEIFETWKYVSVKNFDYSIPFPTFVLCNRYVKKNMKAYKALFGKYGSNSFIMKYSVMVKASCYEKWREIGRNHEEAKILSSLAAGGIIDISVSWIQNNNDTYTPEEISLVETRAIGALAKIEVF